jgi:hypothetical protein
MRPLVRSPRREGRCSPVDIPVGRLTIAADPFGSVMVLIDLTRGRCSTDDSGNVTGVGSGS